MLIAATRAIGMMFGFPDVCNTPVGPATAPLPYPNMGMNAMATPFSPNVRLTMVNALNLASIIPMTTGDEGGVAHPTIKGPGTYKAGNPVVHINLLPGINLCCPTAGNGMNNFLGAVLVPSLTNVFFTYRATDVSAEPNPIAARPLSVTDIESIASLSAEAPEHVFAIVLDECIGYVHIPAFSAAMPTRVGRALRKLQRAGARGLVLDLRDNPGGEYDAFVRLAEEFSAQGQLIGRRTDADGDEVDVRARHDGDTTIALCLLVNANTASAAELFAGSLQWHGRAVLLGKRTFGKGMLRGVKATDGGFVEVDLAMCSLPGGEAIQGVGLSPDVETHFERTSDPLTDPTVALACVELRQMLGVCA